MSPNLDQELNNAIERAKKNAFESQHEVITTAHVVLEILKIKSIQDTFEALNGDLEKFSNELQHYLETSIPKRILRDEGHFELQPTQEFVRILQRAAYQAHASQQSIIAPVQILIAAYNERQSIVHVALEAQPFSKLDIMKFISHNIRKDDIPKGLPQEDQNNQQQSAEPNPLEAFTQNLNKRASQGKIDPLIGRENEVERTIQILSRRRKNNPVLVGDAGVGKTAIAEGLAKRIQEGTVPEILKGCEILSLDLGALVAGTKYRGDFENRIKLVLREIQNRPNTILFIDEIHSLIGAGATGSGGNMDASNLLKPALSNGELRCIGATTRQEYRKIFENEGALSRRFQKITVNPPSVEDTIKILQGLKDQYEKHHEVEYTAEAITAAVKLSERYIPDRQLPDKAIDIIDEVGARQRTLPSDQAVKVITPKEIESIVSQMAQVPVSSVNQNETKQLQGLEQSLSQAVIGQDKASEILTDTIYMSRAGLREPEKPVGVFLFTGPTGVGKTEMCKQLSKQLNLPLFRYDMSEYAEEHSVSRLIGSPPGYVGHGEGGKIIEDVTSKPNCIVLLDEIEKANPKIFNTFLQVFDNGKLTDGQGRVGDFRNCIIIMTSNVGATAAAQKNPMGFSQNVETAKQTEIENALKNTFTPEFRNRIDAIVPFKSLGTAEISKILDKQLAELDVLLCNREKPVSVTYTEEALNYLRKHGFDPHLGARPMKRLIQDKISRQISRQMIEGGLQEGGEVEFDVQNDTLSLNIKTPSVTKKRKAKMN